jgi:hypothetical protein
MTTAAMPLDISIQDIMRNRKVYRFVGQSTDSIEDNSIASASLESLYDAAKHEILFYGRLAKGWDGYDGENFSQALIQSVLSSLEWIHLIFRSKEAQLDALVPGPASDGTIDLELRSGGKKIRLLFDEDREEVSLYRNDGATTNEYPIVLSYQNLEHELSWLVS